MSTGKRVVLATVLSVMLILAPVAGVASAANGGTGTVAAQQEAVDISQDGEKFTISSDFTHNVTVWERAALPLQADLDDASVVVDNQRLDVSYQDDGPINAERDRLGVFDTGENVTLNFDHSSANTEQYAGDDVELVVAYLDEDPEATEFSASDVPTSPDELLDLLKVNEINELVEQAEELEAKAEELRDDAKDLEARGEELDPDGFVEDLEELKEDINESASSDGTSPDSISGYDIDEELEELEELVDEIETKLADADADFDDLREKVDDLKEDGAITSDEAEGFHDRINDLEDQYEEFQKFLDDAHALLADAEDLKNDIEQLQSDIEELEAEAQQHIDDLNTNVEFDIVEDLKLDEDDGTLEVDYDGVDDSGFYAFGLVNEGSFDADEGDISMNDDATVYGVESLIAHDEPTEVVVDDTHVIGEDIDFDVDATALEDDQSTQHAVVLFDKDKWDGTSAHLHVTEELSEDFSAEDITLENDFEGVSGVASIDEDFSLFGQSVSAQSETGIVSVYDLVQFFERETGEDGPVVDTDRKILNGSVTAIGDAGADEEITVETLGNWSEGEYQWVHVATGESSDQVQVNADTITLGSPFFEVDIDEDASETEVESGENATVVADIHNNGTAADTVDVEFEVDGELLETTELELDANETEQVSFETELADEGEYDAVVKTPHDEDTITLVADDDDDAPSPPGIGPAPPSATFEVSDASLSTTKLGVGEDLEVTATVTNVGDASGTHTAELRVDGETVDEVTVDLGEGQSEEISFTHSFAEPGVYDIAIGHDTIGSVTVTTDDPDDFVVHNGALSATEIGVGEDVDASATVTNVGDYEGIFTAELLVDGETVDEQELTIDSGDSVDVTFTETFDEAGEFEIAISDEHAGTLTVTDADAEFEVSDASLSETEIEVGEDVDASATVTNTGDGEGTFTAELQVDGETVAEQDVSLGAGESEEVTFTETFDEAGEYEIAISDEHAGTLSVSEDDRQPGFGALGAIVALAAALIAIRTGRLPTPKTE